MRRRAYLIGDNLATSSPLQGVDWDVQTMSGFLKSSRGGAWEEDEIIPCPSPDAKSLCAALREARRWHDYLFIFFAGHGAYDDASYIALNDEEVLYVRDDLARLSDAACRVTVIVDACRVIVPLPFDDIPLKGVGGPGDVGFVPGSTSRNYRQTCRDMFDRQLWDAGEGLLLIQSCAKGEKAGDNTAGGVYTQALLRGAHASVSGHSDGRKARCYVSLNMLFSSVRADVMGRSGRRQTPQVCCNPVPEFPFAIA